MSKCKTHYVCVKCNEIDSACKCESKYDSILDEAKDITGGDRMKQYGHPEENFNDIARLWDAYFSNKGIDFSNGDGQWLEASDVGMMMVLFKIARQQAGHKRDNLVDMAGYVRNVAQIEGIE